MERNGIIKDSLSRNIIKQRLQGKYDKLNTHCKAEIKRKKELRERSTKREVKKIRGYTMNIRKRQNNYSKDKK